jgi:hypothetical protein
MAGAIHHFLAEDHARLDELLARAPSDRAAYEELRAGLLRHIAMEEKVLFADARARRGGSPLPIVARLHADHAALASLFVPSPTPSLLRTIEQILAEHNPLEEREHGLYETCEELADGDVPELLRRMHAIPAVRMSAHVDEPRIHDHIARMLAARTKY